MQQGAARERMNATVSGRGDRVVVLANGLGTTQESWRGVLEALTPRVRVVRFDYIGMPHAPPAGYTAEPYDTLYGYADDVMSLLDELDVRDALFVGHSVSGMIGLIAATSMPERIARLALIAASPRYLDDVGYHGGFTAKAVQQMIESAAADYQGWAAGFAPLALGADARPDAIHEFTNGLLQLRADVALQSLRTIFFGDYRDVPRRVHQPVTLLQLQDDVAVPMAVSLYLHQQLPHASLMLLAARGHVPQLTAPAEVRLALRGILDEWLEQ